MAQAIGGSEQRFNIVGNRVLVDQHKLLDFTGAHISGGIKTGDIASGDIIKITLTTTPTEATSVMDMQGLLKQIGSLKSDVANMAEAPKGLRNDAEYALSAAREAGEDGDYPRLQEKLESAQKILLDISSQIPTALPLMQATGILLQKAMRL